VTTTLRFGVPEPDADEQSTVLARRSGTAINGDGFRDHFPVGVFLAGTAHTTTVRAVDGIPASFANNTTTHLKAALHHPDVGAKPNHMQYVCWTDGNPAEHEGSLNFSGIIEADKVGGEVFQVAAPMQRTDTNDGWDDWFIDTNGDATLTPVYQPLIHTTAFADTLAQSIVAYYADNPNVLAFHIRDDVGDTDEILLTNMAIAAMQRADPRPATAMWPGAGFTGSSFTADIRLVTRYMYPCGRYLNDTDTAEGDFHRSTFGVGVDFEDVLEDFMAMGGVDIPHWAVLQAHWTLSGSGGSRLRTPTVREFRKQFWTAIGEGVKGIFWFRWSNVSGESVGLADPASADRMAVVKELSSRLTPQIRAHLLRTVSVDDAFVTSGGGRADIPTTYANAYTGTLHNAVNDTYYCVLCNHSLSTAAVTVTSPTLTGSLRNMETDASFRLGSSVSLPALDGGIWMHDPDLLLRAMDTASDNIVTGLRWMRSHGAALTGVTGNGCFEYDITLNAIHLPSTSAPVDDHDGNYGEAHKLHGLCLKYLRTHDASLVADIEAQVQWHIDIEQAIVAQAGSFWAGAAPYWYWTSTTTSAAPSSVEGKGDPNINGGAGSSLTYTQGQVRLDTSVDQAHMVSHALYAYLYLLRNEAAITANTTLRTNATSLLSRMVTWESGNYTAHNGGVALASTAKSVANLYRIIQGLHPLNNTGQSSVLSTYKGDSFGPWQNLNNASTSINPSANSTIDAYFASVWSTNATLSAVTNFLRGRSMDMLSSDISRHDVIWDVLYNGNATPPGTYPTGWMTRAAVGDTLKYATPRTVASQAGFSSDLHYINIAHSSARDGMSGRAAQRLACLCLHALIEPTYAIPLELDTDGTTILRSIPIRDAIDDLADTFNTYLTEPLETNCVRFMAPKYGGTTGSHPTDVVDSAFSGYWMMAVELWHLVNSGASYMDYYPIGAF
jgi:hypothetical protein